MNVFTFSGNLGSDAKQAYTPAGKSIVSFNVACNSGWGDKKKTSWVKCVLFGERGDGVFPYLKKGQKVEVTGKFQMGDEWTNREGKTVSQPECLVNEVELAGNKPTGAPQQAQPASGKQAPRADFSDIDNDCPF